MHRYRFRAHSYASLALCLVVSYLVVTILPTAGASKWALTKSWPFESPQAWWWSNGNNVEPKQYRLAQRYSPSYYTPWLDGNGRNEHQLVRQRAPNDDFYDGRDKNFTRTFRIFYSTPSSATTALSELQPTTTTAPLFNDHRQNFPPTRIVSTTSPLKVPSRALYYYNPINDKNLDGAAVDSSRYLYDEQAKVEQQTSTSPPHILMEPSLATDSNAFIIASSSPIPQSSQNASYTTTNIVVSPTSAQTNVRPTSTAVDDVDMPSAAALTAFDLDSGNSANRTSTAALGIISTPACDIRYGQYAHMQCRHQLGSRAAYCSPTTLQCECRRGYVFDGNTCAHVNTVRIVGDRCTSTTDCQFALANAYCNETFQTCQCVPGFVLGAALNTCVPFAQRIGDTCEIAQQCAAIPNSYCATAADDGRSVTDALTATTSSTIVAFDDELSATMKKRGSGECQCHAGYVPASDSGQTCVPKAQAVGDACVVDRQCQSLWIANLSCISGFCICPPTTMIYLPNNNICASRSGLGQPCLDSAQCDAAVLNAVCWSDTGTCRCRNGYDNFGNQFCLKRSVPRQDPPILRRSPGQSCTSNAECAANNATCSTAEAVCQCNFGFIFIAADSSCRPIAALDETCSFTEQCNSLVLNSACTRDDYADAAGGRRCKCQHGFIPLGDRCIAESSALGDPCTLTAQCQGISKHAVCRSGVCTCEPGVSVQQQQPFGQSGSTATCLDGVMLGGVCTQDVQCSLMVGNSACIGGICSCTTDFKQLAGTNNVCFLSQMATKLGDSCASTAECQNLQLALSFKDDGDHTVVCQDGQCQCEATTHVQLGQRCLQKKQIGENCSDTAQCAAIVNNSICSANNTSTDPFYSSLSPLFSNNKSTFARNHNDDDDGGRICRCRSGTLAISDPTRCIQTNLPTNTLCLRNEQCKSNICQYRRELSAYACTTKLQVHMRLLNQMRSIFSLFNNSSTTLRSLSQLFRRLNQDVLSDARNDAILRPVLLDFMASGESDDEMMAQNDDESVAVDRTRRRLPTTSPTAVSDAGGTVTSTSYGDRKPAETFTPTTTTLSTSTSNLSVSVRNQLASSSNSTNY